MQHSLVYMILPQLIMIFPRVIFMVIYLDMALSAIFKHKNVTLTIYKETVVKSPGYPNENYEQDTNYTWDVTAPATTETIFINVEINIHKFNPCQDYLQIQEINPSSGNFTVFKQCGNVTNNRTANGNRLLITLFSNYDKLTSSGFQIRLKVLGTTTASTPLTTTMHVPTKARTSESTLTTTVPLIAAPSTTITPTKVQTSSTTTPSTTTPSTTTSTPTPSTTTPSTTTPSTTTPSTTTTSTTTSTPKSTTQATSFTTPPKTSTKMTPNINERTSLFTSTATTSALITSDGNASTKTISKLWSSSFQSTRKKSFQRTTKTQPNQSSTSETTNITRLMDIDTSFWNETVILLIGLGVLEVTLIVVGVLAVQRYRRKRRRNGDHTNTLKRQNSCGETHVYEEIDINDVKEEEEESQYKGLPEGVYDTTLKRRSHLKVVGERKSNYSRGSIINMFRTSSFFRRKVNDTSVMTFTSFKGPIQSNIGEKK